MAEENYFEFMDRLYIKWENSLQKRCHPNDAFLSYNSVYNIKHKNKKSFISFVIIFGFKQTNNNIRREAKLNSKNLFVRFWFRIDDFIYDIIIIWIHSMLEITFIQHCYHSILSNLFIKLVNISLCWASH